MLCLQYIPMPVLYGVFLYMGVASLSGIQVGVAMDTGEGPPSAATDSRKNCLQFVMQFT